MVAAANGVGGDGFRSGEENRGGGECSGERMRTRESKGEVRGGRGLRGVAGGTRGGGGSQAGRRWPGRVAARAGRVPVLLAEEEGDSGVAVAGWAAGAAGRLGWTGEQQVGFLLFFIFSFFCFVLFNLFCHCFEFKIIQTMPKTPLNILYC